MTCHLALLAALAFGADSSDLTNVYAVTMLDGRVLTGNLDGLTNKSIELSTADGVVRLDPSKVIHLTPSEAPQLPVERIAVRIEMADGSSLMATGYEVAGRRISISMPGDGDFAAGSQEVMSVRWLDHDPPPTVDERAALDAQWSDARDRDSTGDILVIRKTFNRDDRQTIALDYLEGVLSNINDTEVLFDFNGQRLEVRRQNKIEGVIYYRPERDQLATPFCRIVEVSGSRYAARAVQLDGGVLRLTTVTDRTFELPIQRVSKIDYSFGKLVYLSDMTPVTVEWTPFISAIGADDGINHLMARLYRPRSDQGFGERPLQLRTSRGTPSRTYAKGLAVHSRTELVYRMSGRYQRFLSTVGMDARTGGQGHVQLTISADDKILLDTELDGSDAPLEIDLDISGARRLQILVDFGDNLDIGDHLNLCDARVSK